MMKRSLATLVTLSCLLSLMACDDWSATSTSPFYNDTDVAYDPGLVGEWILHGDNQPWDTTPVKLTFAEGHSTATAATTSKPLDKQKSYKFQIQTLGTGNEMAAVLFEIDGEQFLDIERSGTSDYHLLLPDTLTTHKVLRVKLHGDVLIVSYLRGDWAQTHAPKDHWQTPAMLLPTDDLKKLLSQSLKERDAFSCEYRFTRKDSEAAEHDKVDYAARQTAYEFAHRGDYDSTLKALRLALSTRPDNVDVHALLGVVQIANGDGDGARKSISSWAQQCRDVLDHGFGAGTCFPIEGMGSEKSPEQRRATLNTFEHALVGVSYFAEQNWNEANREFALVVRSDERSAEKEFLGDNTVTFLQNLALQHLRRKGEAAAELEKTRESIEDGHGKSLADYLLGKIKQGDLLKPITPNGDSSVEGECAEECQTYFYIGSQYFAAGDRKRARVWFQKTLDIKQFLGVEPIIARVQLDHLGD